MTRIVWLGKILFGMKLLNVGDSDSIQRVFGAMSRPAIGMAMKNQLMEGLHGHVAGIVVIADDLAEDLRPDPLNLLFVECGVLKHVGKERKSEVERPSSRRGRRRW